MHLYPNFPRALLSRGEVSGVGSVPRSSTGQIKSVLISRAKRSPFVCEVAPLVSSHSIHILSVFTGFDKGVTRPQGWYLFEHLWIRLHGSLQAKESFVSLFL